MANIERIGYGQVEPNHMSAQKTGQIFAQLPAASTITILENGQFLRYVYDADSASGNGIIGGEAKPTANRTDGEWMMVYNEVKLYDERKQSYKDFAQKQSEAVDKVIVPRLFKLNVGDIFTTNCVGTVASTSDGTAIDTGIDEAEAYLTPDTATGYLVAGTASSEIVLKNLGKVTLPDGQYGLKLQVLSID